MFLVLLFAAMLNAVLQIIVVNQHVSLFTPSYIVFKVCNPSSIIIQASSLTITGVNALDPLPISIGRIAPLMCKEFVFHFIPYSTKPMKAKLTYMYMGQKGPITGNVEYLIPLDLKIPTLQSIPISANVLETGKLEIVFKVLNPSAFPFNGTIEVTSNTTKVILLKAYIPPKSDKIFKVQFKSLTNKLEVKYLMDGIVIGTDKLTFQVPRPNVMVTILNETLSTPGFIAIKISSPILLKGTLILQGNCLPLPQERNVAVYGQKIYMFKIESCNNPANLKVLFSTPFGKWMSSKTIPIKTPTVALSTLTLQSGAVNKVKVVVIGSNELVRIQIPNAIVRPLIGRPNTTFTVIPLPTNTMKSVTANVIIGNNKYTFNLLLLPFNPVIDFDINKKTLIEGTIENVTLCVKNAWTYDIENVTLTFSVLGKSVTSSFNFPQGSKRCLSLNVTSPWYPAKVSASANLEVLGYTISRKFTLQVAKNPNLITLNITCPSKVKWNQKTISIKISAQGEGEIKNLDMVISGDFITSKSFKFEIISNGFSKVLSLPLSITKGVNTINLNVALSYTLCLSSCKDVQETKKCSIKVELPPPPSLKLQLKSYTLYLSKTNKVTVIVNAKGEFKDVTASVTAKNAVVIGSSVFDLGQFKGTKSFSFFLTPQSPSPVVLTITLNVKDMWGTLKTFKYTFNLMVKKPKEPRIAINILTPKLMVGNNKLKILISNVGNSKATNVNINIVSPDVVVLKPSITLKSMLPGQKIVEIIEVNVPQTLAGSSAQLTASALYSNITSTYNFKLPVYLGPQLKITDISLIPQKIPPGVQATLSLVLTNQGDDKAFSVKVSLILPKRFNIVGPSTIFLGVVGAQASLPVAFTILPKQGTAPGTYVGKILVTYSYAGSQYKIEQPITIIVSPQQSQPIQETYVDWRYFAAAGAVLIIIILWGVRRVRTSSTSSEGLEE